MSRRLLLAPLCAATIACAPTAEPVGMAIDDLNWNTVDAHVEVKAENPWPVDLTVLGVTYQVQVGKQQVATGALTEPVTVPAGGRKRFDLPLSVDTLAATAAVQSHDDDTPVRTTPAVISGEITFHTPIGPMTVPIEHADEVPLLRQPTLRQPHVAVKELNLRKGSLKLVVGITVENPNAIELIARKMDYGASLAGQKLLKGQREVVELAASDTTELRFPIEVDFSAIGRGAVQALQDKRIEGEVWLSGRVHTPWKVVPLQLRRSGEMKVR